MKKIISSYLRYLGKKYGKSRVFIRFILSYIIILIIPLCLIGLFSSRRLVQELYKETKNSTMANLSQVMDTLDMRLKALDYTTVQLSQNKSIIPMLYNKDINSLSEYQFYKIISELKNYRATNGFIDNIFIYFRNSDVIISADGKYRMSAFFSRVYHYKNLFESDFRYILDNSVQPIVRPMEMVEVGGSAKPLITFIRPIPMSDTIYNATLLITLDADAIDKTSHNVLGNSDGEVYIFDEKNNMIYGLGSNADILKDAQIKSLIRSGDKAIYENKLNGKKQLVTYLKSPHTGWSYMTVIHSDQILKKANLNRLWASIMIFLSIAIGIALSYYFSYGNYYPLKEIVEKLSNYSKPQGNEDAPCENEFSAINDVLTNVIAKNKNLEIRLNEQMPIMRSNVLTRLLKGEFTEQDEASKMMDFIGIEALKGPFAVMILSIDDYEEFIEQKSVADREAYKFSIVNVVEELCLKAGISGYAANFSDERISFIIDFKGNVSNCANKLISTGKMAKSFFDGKFNFNLTIGIGKTYASLIDISKSYIEAKTAIDYKLVKGKNTVIMFEEIASAKNERYFYSLQNEKMIFNYIKEGNFEGIREILNSIIENVNAKPVNINTARLIYYQVVSTAMNALAELSPEDYNEIMRHGEEMPDLLKCDTLEEVCGETMAYYKIICGRIKTTEKSKSSEFGESVIRYIYNNYTDSNISLNYLADKFSVTPAYLSRFFKSYTQCNFLDYLHQLRLKKVKGMLRSTDKSIAEIASICGYLDSHSLIRSFKKYEGMTPGQFREINRNS